LDEEAVRIMTSGQRNPASGYPLRAETPREALRGASTTAVGIGIESQVDGSGAVAQLLELADVEMVSQRADASSVLCKRPDVF